VVWNPGAEVGARIGDLQSDGYQRYVCIEAAAVSRPVKLSPGERWEGCQILVAM
jgi:glucose-6-phosphate 1-epimerase